MKDPAIKAMDTPALGMVNCPCNGTESESGRQLKAPDSSDDQRVAYRNPPGPHNAGITLGSAARYSSGVPFGAGLGQATKQVKRLLETCRTRRHLSYSRRVPKAQASGALRLHGHESPSACWRMPHSRVEDNSVNRLSLINIMAANYPQSRDFVSPNQGFVRWPCCGV
jgi:hypothetical protein